jgi:hypothetical protein
MSRGFPTGHCIDLEGDPEVTRSIKRVDLEGGRSNVSLGHERVGVSAFAATLRDRRLLGASDP